MTIDVWAQITTERMARAPWLATLLRWTGRANTFVLQSPQSTLASMDAARVDIALLSAWYGPEGSLISNEEVAAQVEAAPTRFRGLASADLRADRSHWPAQAIGVRPSHSLFGGRATRLPRARGRRRPRRVSLAR